MTNPLDNALSAVRREPLAMAIARQLREAILAGELPEGTPLPSEKELSARLQAMDHDRIEGSARRINGGRTACRAGSDDKNTGFMGISHAGTLLNFWRP